MLSCNVCLADIVPVYLAGGQSNAKPAWATAIQTELRKVADTDSAVVSSYHSGAWLNSWFKDGAPVSNGHYYEDLLAINTAMTTIASGGDTPVFSGIFWFQGEGDSFDPVSMRAYKHRFLGMLDQYETDLGVSNINFAVMAIDANFDYPSAGRTVEKIDTMRSVLFDLGDEPNGLTVDTRPFTRIGNFWHLTNNQLTSLGTISADRFNAEFIAVPELSPGLMGLGPFLCLGRQASSTTQALIAAPCNLTVPRKSYLSDAVNFCPTRCRVQGTVPN
jgi:hypothetical protein